MQSLAVVVGPHCLVEDRPLSRIPLTIDPCSLDVREQFIKGGCFLRRNAPYVGEHATNFFRRQRWKTKEVLDGRADLARFLQV